MEIMVDFIQPSCSKIYKKENFNYFETHKMVKNISKQILLIDCFFAKKYIFAAY